MYYIPISPTNSSFSAALAALAALAAALVATLAATITAGSPSPLFLGAFPGGIPREARWSQPLNEARLRRVAFLPGPGGVPGGPGVP